MAPIIGITPDTLTPTEDEKQSGLFRYVHSCAYARCVEAAGGVALVLPYQPRGIPHYLEICDGFVLGGGDDPDTRPFGEAVHPQARRVLPERQEFEIALLEALEKTDHPVLGVCLGMQWMALVHGGRLLQHLPEAPGISSAAAAVHRQGEHAIVPESGCRWLGSAGRVHSHHHQAAGSVGKLRVAARSDAESGSVIEALDRGDTARFYRGVQWHPERTADPLLGQGLFDALVKAAAR